MSRPECKVASRMPPRSVSIFLVLKESNWNALRMTPESLDCRSNAARMRLECRSNVPTRMQECTSNAVRIFRLLFKCGLNAAQLLKCNDQDARMHPDWRRNLFRYFRYIRYQLECILNAVGIFRLPLECGSNAVRMTRPGCQNAS